MRRIQRFLWMIKRLHEVEYITNDCLCSWKINKLLEIMTFGMIYRN